MTSSRHLATTLFAGVLGLAAAAGDAIAAARKDEPQDLIEINLLLKIQKGGDKTPLEGASVEHHRDGKWQRFGTSESEGTFSTLGDSAAEWKGRQSNCSNRGRAAVRLSLESCRMASAAGNVLLEGGPQARGSGPRRPDLPEGRP